MADPAADARAERLKQVREATGLTQLQFLPRLNGAASALGAKDYSQSTLSKLETGAQDASFVDVSVFATVDPLGRGKLWLAWGDAEDATLARPKAGPSVIKSPSKEQLAKRAVGKHATPKKREA